MTFSSGDESVEKGDEMISSPPLSDTSPSLFRHKHLSRKRLRRGIHQTVLLRDFPGSENMTMPVVHTSRRTPPFQGPM